MNTLLEFLRSFILGASAPLKASALILRNKKLLLLSLLPLLISLLIAVFGFATLKSWLSSIGLHYLAGLGLNPETMALKVVMVLFQLILFGFGTLLFTYLVSFCAAPFNDFLAEASEAYITPSLPPPPAHTQGFFNKSRLLVVDLFKTAAALMIQLGLLLVSVLTLWMPLLHVVTLVLTCWLMTFNFISYAQTRRGEGLFKGLGFVLNHPFSSLGFGLAMGMLFSVPVLSLAALPLAVVGGTYLFAQVRNPIRKYY